MKLRINWQEYIEALRVEELNIIFQYLNHQQFETGLEIGAGNGFQSKILKTHIKKLYCTELNKERLMPQDIEGIIYKIADAEHIDNNFNSKFFDLIYSSNLFEHLPNPHLAISGTKKILKDDGLMIHIIPSSFNAIVRVLLWYPNLFLTGIEKCLNYSFKGNKGINDKKRKSLGNNIKLKNSSRSKIRRLMVPGPHGVSSNILKEVIDFSKRRWIKEFENSGFKIIKVIKGPVCSGYGFGLNRTKKVLEKLGFTGEYIYILKKQ